jgi:hypothetical protein
MEKWRKIPSHSVENLTPDGSDDLSLMENRRLTVNGRYQEKFSLRKGRRGLASRANPENPKEPDEKQLLGLMGHYLKSELETTEGRFDNESADKSLERSQGKDPRNLSLTRKVLESRLGQVLARLNLWTNL